MPLVGSGRSPLGRSHGHHRAVPVTVSGQVSCPPLGSSCCPLTHLRPSAGNGPIPFKKRNSHRWFPRSLLFGQRARCPALPLRSRRGYSAGLHHDLPGPAHVTVLTVPRPRHPPGWQARRKVRTAHQPRSTGFELVDDEEVLRHRFLAYTFPSCSPGTARPVVPNRPDFVAAAPTLPGVPRFRLPPASPSRCDGQAM